MYLCSPEGQGLPVFPANWLLPGVNLNIDFSILYSPDTLRLSKGLLPPLPRTHAPVWGACMACQGRYFPHHYHTHLHMHTLHSTTGFLWRKGQPIKIKLACWKPWPHPNTRMSNVLSLREKHWEGPLFLPQAPFTVSFWFSSLCFLNFYLKYWDTQSLVS